MKLYTEEEIKRVFELFQHSSSDIPLYLQELKPIELPSDEEIENNAYSDRRVDDWEHEQEIGFERGAKWMKEQILNQKKLKLKT